MEVADSALVDAASGLAVEWVLTLCILVSCIQQTHTQTPLYSYTILLLYSYCHGELTIIRCQVTYENTLQKKNIHDLKVRLLLKSISAYQIIFIHKQNQCVLPRIKEYFFLCFLCIPYTTPLTSQCLRRKKMDKWFPHGVNSPPSEYGGTSNLILSLFPRNVPSYCDYNPAVKDLGCSFMFSASESVLNVLDQYLFSWGTGPECRLKQKNNMLT